MSEDRQAGRDNRSGFDGDTAEIAWSRPQADVIAAPEAPDAHAPIVLTAIPDVVAPAPLNWFAGRSNRLKHWWRGASGNLRGSLYMMSAMLFYAVMAGAMKHVGAAIPLVEILLIRQIIMSAIIAVFAGAALPVMLKTTRPGLQVLRALVTLASMLAGFAALIHIPLAQATAIGFSQILFVTIAAVVVLKEKVDGRRWAATAFGFVGVLIMLNPSSKGLDFYALMSVAGALFGAVITISVRMLAATERTETILLYQCIVLVAVLALPTWWWWVSPNAEQWFWIAVLSLFGTAGQWLITRAYQVGEAAALAPLDFTRLILSCFTGFVFFAEIPALTTAIGAAIVIGATLYTIRKNSCRKNARPVIAAAP